MSGAAARVPTAFLTRRRCARGARERHGLVVAPISRALRVPRKGPPRAVGLEAPMTAPLPGNAERLPLLAGRPAALKALGYDERWLQDWLAADPSHLGLGDVRIIDQEQGQAGAGTLDLLALDAET